MFNMAICLARDVFVREPLVIVVLIYVRCQIKAVSLLLLIGHKNKRIIALVGKTSRDLINIIIYVL